MVYGFTAAMYRLEMEFNDTAGRYASAIEPALRSFPFNTALLQTTQPCRTVSKPVAL